MVAEKGEEQEGLCFGFRLRQGLWKGYSADAHIWSSVSLVSVHATMQVCRSLPSQHPGLQPHPKLSCLHISSSDAVCLRHFFVGTCV